MRRRMLLIQEAHIVLHVVAGSFLVWAWLVSADLTLTATDYASALDKSILFFDVQRSGKLPSWQRVNWRANSALTDGKTSNVRIHVIVKNMRLMSKWEQYTALMMDSMLFLEILGKD